MTSTYNILRELNEWQSDFAKQFHGNSSGHFHTSTYPLTNFIEKEDEFVITALLPGVDPKDVDITYENNILTISGEKKSDVVEKQKYHRQERPFGKFSRTLKVRVAIDPDKIRASYNNGILEISLKKAEEAKPVKIEVK